MSRAAGPVLGSGYPAYFTFCAAPHAVAAPRPVHHLPRFESAEYVTSVAEAGALAGAPLEVLPELAFVGRSNAGKSTALNLLARQRRLAFASKTPGRTQMLNFFAVRDNAPPAQQRVCAYLVDLPGYGFAKTDERTRARWDELVGGYLATRRMLCGVVLVMDSRRPFMASDDALVAWICGRGDAKRFRLHLLLTKADQVGKSERRSALALAQGRAEELPMPTSVQLFSAVDRTGIEELQDAATGILAPDD